MDLAAFVPPLGRHLAVEDPGLLEKDVRLHLLLARLARDERCSTLALKGGTCLIKCHFDYPRFSEDLDFTHVAARPVPSGSKVRRRELRSVREPFLAAVSDASAALGMKAQRPVFNRNSGTVTVGLSYDAHTRVPGRVKLEVNFIEPLLYRPVQLMARSLLAEPTPELRLIDDALATAYAEPVACRGYDRREIVAEKGRAVLTRQALKGRDVLDLFLLAQDGRPVERQLADVRAKLRFAVEAFDVSVALLRDETRLRYDIREDVRRLALKPVDTAAVAAYWERIRPVLAGVAREVADEMEAKQGSRRA